jgi:hypothetical protein
VQSSMLLFPKCSCRPNIHIGPWWFLTDRVVESQEWNNFLCWRFCIDERNLLSTFGCTPCWKLNPKKVVKFKEKKCKIRRKIWMKEIERKI